MVINYEEKNVFKNVDAILEKRNVLTFKRILLYIILVHWYTRRPHVPGLNESMVQMYIICTSCIIINIVYILYCVHYCSASARKMWCFDRKTTYTTVEHRCISHRYRCVQYTYLPSCVQYIMSVLAVSFFRLLLLIRPHDRIIIPAPLIAGLRRRRRPFVGYTRMSP